MKWMGKLAIVSASLLAMACSGGEQPAADESVSQPPSPPANIMQPGLYAVGDGTQIYSRTRLSEDGTYTDLNDAMERVGGGTWEQRGEQMCFDPEGDGEDQQERCWTNSQPDADGRFVTSRVDADESYTVTPIAE